MFFCLERNEKQVKYPGQSADPEISETRRGSGDIGSNDVRVDVFDNKKLRDELECMAVPMQR